MTEATQHSRPEHASGASKPGVILVGRGPRPTSGEALSTMLRGRIAAAWPKAEGIDHARVGASVDGANIGHLAIDLSGVSTSTRPEALVVVPVAPDARREPGTLGRLDVQAHPVTIAGAAIDVSAEVSDLSFEWVMHGDDLGIRVIEPSADAPLTGHARIAVAKDALAHAIERIAADELAGAGVTLKDLTLDVVSLSPQAATLTVGAKIRKGILGAHAEGGATVRIDDAMVLTVSDVHATSRNPIIAAMLAVYRGKIASFEGRRIPIADVLPPGVRVAEVSLEAGHDIVLTVRVA